MLSRLRLIRLGNMLRKIRRLGLVTMTIVKRNQDGGTRSQGQQKFSVTAPSSSNVPSSKKRYDHMGRTLGSKSQGSISGTKTYPTCPKICKNHPGKCLEGKAGCFGCGQSGHKLRDFPSRQGQGGSNGRAQSTT